MLTFLVSGIVYGASAGISPGPLLALVIRESLTSGWRAGVRVALAPLITDIPIVILTLVLLSRFSTNTIFPGIIACAGAIFLLYLGIETLRVSPTTACNGEETHHTFTKALIANWLSPHPYVFWLLVGAPTALRAAESHVMSAIAFALGFYVLLIGTKAGVAILTGRSRQVLSSRGYIYVMRTLGIALLIFAALLVRDGIGYLSNGIAA